ncbi:MAG: hypothetical protein IAE88_11585 [Rhodobacteraceae bacterium]|nr:hypothetical protein [Paracoccaceae bacterium]
MTPADMALLTDDQLRLLARVAQQFASLDQRRASRSRQPDDPRKLSAARYQRQADRMRKALQRRRKDG